MKKKLVFALVLSILFQGVMPYVSMINQIYAQEILGEVALPSRYDARELGLVSPVKNQGRSNACWAHAAMSSVETAFKKAGYNTEDFYDFSEGHLAVNSSPLTDLQSGSTGYDAINYFSRLDGPVKDGRYPEDSEFYEFSIARSGSGTLFNGIPLLRDVNQKKHMKFVGDMIVISNKTDEIKRYIMEYGSVMSSYYQETHRLFGPVMTETADNRSRVENAYHATSKRRANHAVILVGWDDNIEIKESLFSKKTVRGAYLVKNSWGTQLKGMDGYYWMSYSSFGSDKNYVFTNVSEKKENANVYLYDTYGTSSLSGVTVDEPENIFLNLFERKTENPERITDIPLSIYQVENQEVDYDIYIGQSNEEDRNWINQEENFTLVRTDKAINRNGFYTIKLLDEVTVSQKYFAVKLVLRRNGTKTPSIGNGKEVNDVKHNASYIFNAEKGKFDLESSYNLSLRAITEEVVSSPVRNEIAEENQDMTEGSRPEPEESQERTEESAPKSEESPETAVESGKTPEEKAETTEGSEETSKEGVTTSEEETSTGEQTEITENVQVVAEEEKAENVQENDNSNEVTEDNLSTSLSVQDSAEQESSDTERAELNADTPLIPFIPVNEETQSDEENQEQVEVTQKPETLSSRETKKTATADTVGKLAEKETVAEKIREEITVSYKDIGEDSPYLEAIAFVVKNRFMQGTDKEIFSPEAKTTRAAVVQVLYNYRKQPAIPAKHSFLDVARGSWYEKAVVWAWQSGLVSGMDKQKFAPEQNITTEQLAVILHHFDQLQEKEKHKSLLPKGKTDLSWQDYWDEKAISPWAVDAMKWLLEHNLLPDDKEKVNPKAEISRGELAVILQKYVMGMEKN